MGSSDIEKITAFKNVCPYLDADQRDALAATMGIDGQDAIEPDDSLYGIVNGLTRAGNDRSLGIESREKLQMTGGRILELAGRGTRWID